MRDEIKLMLNHDYLQIEVFEKNERKSKIQLPVRTAKIIGEMFERRKGDNKDLLHYCRWVGDNVKYKVGIWIKGLKYGSELGEWMHHKISPISEKDLKEVGGSYK